MATIKYQVKENTTVGTHSFFAQAVSYSTLNISDLADEISEGVGVSPTIVRAILDRYAIVAERQVMRGHRVKLGDLLTLYPQISVSVKDELDEHGKVVKAVTADKFTIMGAKSSIGATLSQSVQQKFASSVSWKRVGSTGTTSDDSDDTSSSDGGTSPDGGSTGGSTGGTSGGDSASSGSGNE